ncbi:MAG: hypothetical protein ACRENL_00090 [Candidatus Dormibacteria bacterium]
MLTELFHHVPREWRVTKERLGNLAEIPGGHLAAISHPVKLAGGMEDITRA